MRATAALGAALLLAALAASTPGQEPPREGGETILGAPAAIGPEAGTDRWHRVAAGTRLRREPDFGGAVLVVVDVDQEVEVVERRPPWLSVRYGPYKGWIYLGDGADPAAELQVGPLARPAPPELLARARSLLAADTRPRELPGLTLWSDVADGPLLADLAAVATGLDSAYRERFGATVLPPSGEVVVLFAREEAYRAFEAGEASLERLGAHGLAGNGLAVLAAGDRPRAEVRRLLIHELVHLASRRALGTELPPWIEEGLAEDLAYCRLTSSGELRLGTLDAEVRVAPAPGVPGLGEGRLRQVTVLGPGASLTRLANALGEPGTPALAELVALPWSEFVAPEGRDLHYALAAFFVRYLLDGAREGEGAAFRRHLALLSSGERPDPADLAAYLGTTWEAIQAAFERWVQRAAEAPRSGS